MLTSDPGDEETLQKAYIEDARAILVAMNNDTEGALSVLSTRDLMKATSLLQRQTERMSGI